LGPHASAIPEQMPGATLLHLPNPTKDMRQTVETALGWLEEYYSPSAQDYWLLTPVDCPAFSSETVHQLVLSLCEHQTHAIAVPVYAGQRGHPTLFRCQTVEHLRTLAPGQGINAFIHLLEAETLEVPVPDP